MLFGSDIISYITKITVFSVKNGLLGPQKKRKRWRFPAIFDPFRQHNDPKLCAIERGALGLSNDGYYVFVRGVKSALNFS